MSNDAELITFTLDEKKIQVPKGTTIYHAAKNNGIELPIFCYHDRMPPFGACRVCLVEVEKMPKLQTSCTLEATEGMVVRTQSHPAVQGRKDILEFLLINHPLDCPICDKGGECPLQDQALEYGPGKSKFFEEKRHFTKAHSLGPVLMLDRERCIVCARCTRFGDEVAGDHALQFIERGYKTEVGTPDGGPADSKFIGNTIEICPVGALTSQVYRFRARPWDNHTTPTTCTLCPVGCSMLLDERDGQIMRTRSCENHDVNDVWLCDKGWFGYEFITHPDRLQKPLVRKNGTLTEASWDEALTLIADKLRENKENGLIAAFGGNPLTVEENYQFQQLFREGAGVDHIDHRIGTPIIPLDQEGLQPGMEMSIGECEGLKFAYLFGLDLTEEFPVIWLRLRKAINKGAKVQFLGHHAPEISRYLEKAVLHAPGKELEIIKGLQAQIEERAKDGAKGAFFIGSQYLASPYRAAILEQLAAIKEKYPHLTINLMEGNGNSLGARYAGMRPDLLPMHKQPSTFGLNAVQVVQKAASDGWDILYVAGANPAKKYPKELWKKARKGLKFLVVQDLFLTETAKEADVVLPTLSFIEKEGSFINIEGRIQKVRPGKDIPHNIYSDGEIFNLIAMRLGIMLHQDPFFANSLDRTHIQISRKVTPAKTEPYKASPRSLSASFSTTLFDQGVRMKHNTHVSQLTQEPAIRIYPTDADERKILRDAKVKVSANGFSVVGKVQFDESVAKGTVILPLGFDQIPVHELGPNLLNGLPVEIEGVG